MINKSSNSSVFAFIIFTLLMGQSILAQQNPVIGVGGISHESNSFSLQKTDIEAFGVSLEMPEAERKARFFALENAKTVSSGYIAGAKAHGIALYPALLAGARPDGPVTDDAFNKLVGAMIDQLKAGPKLDGILLNLHGANEYRFKVGNIDSAINALKGAGITDFSINETDGTVTFTDVFDFADAQLQDKIGKFVELLDENNISYEQQQFRPTESRYVDKGKRKEIIRRIKSDGARLESRGQGFRETLEQSIQRDAVFQGTTPEEYSGVEPKKPAAGNRLFNEPLKAVAEIADRYYQRAFGAKRPDFKGTRKIDKARNLLKFICFSKKIYGAG